jgi:predicted nucleic acid-binding protein
MLDANMCSYEHISMRITPQAIQELLDELESSKQSRLRAWAVLQEFRMVLTSLGGVNIKAPSKKTFDAEGSILREALVDCLRERHAALAQLADAARRVDQAAFGSGTDFPQAHQALLKALDRAESLLQTS